MKQDTDRDNSTAEILTPCKKEAFKAFLTAHAQISRELDRRLQACGYISLATYDVLVTLEYEEGYRLRMSDLADRVVFSRSGLTRFVDRLVSEGYVEREPCSDDRRGSFAKLTKKGLAARLEAWKIFEPLLEEFWGELVSEAMATKMADIFDQISEKARASASTKLSNSTNL